MMTRQERFTGERRTRDGVAGRRPWPESEPARRAPDPATRRVAAGAGVSLTGKVAIVTGSSRSLGRHIAEVFARHGARVVVTARPDRDGSSAGCEAVASAIRATGGEAIAIPCDVATEDSVHSLVGATIERYGRVDILVNNAAMRLSTKLLDTEPEDMERIIAVNVLGPFFLWKHAIPGMIERGAGNVISIVSTNAPRQPFFGMAPYRMTKAALTFLSVDLAQEIGPYGVAVNAFDPGPVLSDGTAEVRAARERRYNVRIPYHSQDPVEVLDEPIVWLAGQTVATFTGQVVRRVEFSRTWGPTVSASVPHTSLPEGRH
jgi:3-oxoacyl-[acyl-carrier protein] reductase